MTGISHILFPHTQIAASDLEKIINHFGQLTICQPWFMEQPVLNKEQANTPLVHIQHPDTAKKPKSDFKKLISEYRLWISQNHDKGLGNFWAAVQEESPTENTPWEIRQLISKGDNHSDLQENEVFKWHLILHLAREFETSRVAAEKMLNRLINQKSPLEGALEQTPPQRFFEDTPLMKTQLNVDEFQLIQIFEAWFGLFGEYVSDDVTLITLDPLVISDAFSLLEPEEQIIKPEDHKKKEPSGDIYLLPNPPEDEKISKNPVIKGLSGKTMILMKS